MDKVYRQTGIKRVRKSLHNLSYEKLMTADMGILYPVAAEECLPGDVFKIGYSAILRMNPLVAPILHNINVSVHYFFVPYRLMEDNWEEFITGGKDGTDTTVLDRWTPTGNYSDEGSLWDYFGFPVSPTPGTSSPILLPGTQPLAFPLTAYNRIWNYYYRDQNLQIERLDTDQTFARRNWQKDYFTASLPWLQRGVAPSIELSGSPSAEWQNGVDVVQGTGSFTPVNPQVNSVGTYPIIYSGGAGTSASNLVSALNANTIDVSGIGTFSIHDLRLMTQIQRWMELNARNGVRLKEFMASNYGVKVHDYRIQEPEYIGGSKQPIIISEVLQTSESGTTPQGNLSGHGISAGGGFVGKYRCQEHGIIIGLMSISPDTVYQQGLNRQWLRETRYDFPLPIFANLSEQEVLQVEIYATHNNQTANETIFGYIGRYDECRVKNSMIVGEMRSTLDYWHISRQFASPPLLNGSFLECNPRKDMLAVPSAPAFVIQFGNNISAVRPIPFMSNPGMN